MSKAKNGKLSIRLYKQETKKNSYGQAKKHIDKKTGKVKTTRATYKSFINQFLHDLRFEKMENGYLKRPENTEENKNLFFDLELEDEIFTMINSESEENLEQIPKLFNKIKKAYKKKYGRKLHKQTKPSLNFLLSFESEFDLTPENRQKQFDSVQNFINKKFDFPIYLVQHNDEKSLHYSFSVMNFDKELSPIAKKIDTFNLQDEIADHLKEEGQEYGHTRGVSKAISFKEHKSIMESKANDAEEKLSDIKNEMKQLQEEIFKTKLENIELKNENEELKELSEELIEDFENILSDLEKLGEEKDAIQFVKMFKRYLKTNSKPKLEKLVAKFQRMIIKKKKLEDKKIGEENADFTDYTKNDKAKGKTKLK